MTAESFLRELKRLIEIQPKPPTRTLTSENCENNDYVFYSKNLSFCFDCAKCGESIYLYDSYMSTNCYDCDYAVESQLCYESVDPFRCFNCDYLDYCANLRDASYCFNCTNCNNVFGCANLKNKSFCIFNRQLTESEYREAVKKFKSIPAEKILLMLEELKKRYPLTQTHEEHNENSPYGNYIHYCKNCYLCFDAAHNEYCGYLYDSFYNKACYDLTYCANSELSYQAIDSDKIYSCNFSVYSTNCQDGSFLFNCFDVKKSLGCVGLSHKQYCILNRQLTQEEYQRVSSTILKELNTKNLGFGTLVF